MSIGKPWSYGDLFELSSKNAIEAVTITSDGKNAIAIDTNHVSSVASDNLHVIKLFPENIDSLLQNLINNHINVDILDIPKNEFFEVLSKVGEAFYNISIYFLVFSLLVFVCFFQRGCVLVLCFFLNGVMVLRFVCGAGIDVVFLLFVFVVVCVVSRKVSLVS